MGTKAVEGVVAILRGVKPDEVLDCRPLVLV